MNEVASLHVAIEVCVHGSNLALVVVIGLREIKAAKDIKLTATLRDITRAVGSTLVQIW